METLAGRYVLEERLGSGGTATVWRALDTRLGVPRAVKLLDVAHGPERDALRERLRSEARAMARVVHPHVVAVHDVGEDGDRDFIVMDLVDGPSLADRLAAEGPLAPDDAVRIAIEILQALTAAHAEGMVHRDVKPGNVLIDATGEARLCDFGIALLEAEHRHTKTGVALGSLPYMAPEQRRDARSVGPQADLYGVACTLYNALTCATPVDLYLAPGRSPRWAMVPEALVPVIRRATAAEPGDRYTDATSMARALLRASASDVPNEPTLDLVPGATAEVDPSPAELSGGSTKQPGRAAVWMGMVATLIMTILGFTAVIRLQNLVAERTVGPQPAPSTAPSELQVEGAWRGVFDADNGMVLVLRGPDDALEGEVEIHFGSVIRTGPVTGSFDRDRAELVLADEDGQPGAGTYTANWDRRGVWAGEFRGASGAEALPFVLMRSQ